MHQDIDVVQEGRVEMHQGTGVLQRGIVVVRSCTVVVHSSTADVREGTDEVQEGTFEAQFTPVQATPKPGPLLRKIQALRIKGEVSPDGAAEPRAQEVSRKPPGRPVIA